MITFTEEFRKGLELLEYDENSSTTILFVNDYYENISPEEALIIEKAKYYKADGVYIRKFPDNRTPMPQIFIYDFTAKNASLHDFAEIHKILWSANVVPLFFVFTNSEVKIFNTTKPVKLKGHAILTEPIKTLELASKIDKEFKKYSFKLFDNGSFWETDYNSGKYSSKNSVYSKLITGLRAVRQDFLQKKKALPVNIAHKLLVLCILIKYLEERTDNESNKVFPPQYFKKFSNSTNFCEVLRKKGECLNLFDSLSAHFNGKIFEWEDQNERELLENTDLSILADFLDATIDIKKQQYVLWPLYSFNHLPIELISSIYDEFLGIEKGVVYTPPHLVNFIIDETMPLNQPKLNITILDPSCGSGIFLVIAFKRMVEWLRVIQFKKNHELRKPELNELKSVILNSLYGVDLKKDAVQLAIFSLSLALCDELSPTQIWYQLKFDDLSNKNILNVDFFDYARETNMKFDLIIGNPPFEENINSNSALLFVKERAENGMVNIPQKQISLLFLSVATKLLKQSALLCLIIPSGPLLYNKTLNYRKELFKLHNIKQIIDFTNLQSSLFNTASYPVVCIFLENKKPDSEPILHVTIRRTRQAKERIIFEIDYYDFNYVDKSIAIENDYIWKCNLIGGGRLFYLIKRLSQFRNIGQYLKDKIDKEGWAYNRGYTIGKKNSDKKANYISGKKSIATKAFDEYGLDRGGVFVERAKLFKDPSNEKIFKAPHILLKENFGEKTIPLQYLDYPLTFKDKIIGIHAPKKYVEDLKKLYRVFKKYNNLYRFFIASTSSQLFIGRATAFLKDDIDVLPYPEDIVDLQVSLTEQYIIDEVLSHIVDYMKKGDNSRIFVNDVTQDEILAYSSLYCEILNSVYEKDSKTFKLEAYKITETFIFISFAYSILGKNVKKADIADVSIEYINDLVYQKIGKHTGIIRAVRFYDKNKIVFIKPKKLRYWLNITALRDADDTFRDLTIQGY